MKRVFAFLKQWYWAFILLGIMVWVVIFFWPLFATSKYLPKKDVEDIVYYKKISEFIYDESEEDKVFVLSDNISSYNDQTYAINPDNQFIYVYKNGEKEGEPFIQKQIDCFIIVEDSLYYTEQNQLWSINLQSGKEDKYGYVNVDLIFVTYKNVYFVDVEGYICRIDFSNMEAKRITDKRINEYWVRGDKVFYIAVLCDGFDCFSLLYAINNDGSNSQLLVETSVENIEIQKNTIYFTEVFGDRELALNLLEGTLIQTNNEE